MNLLASLREFDGKHTEVLEQLNAKLPKTEDSLVQLLAIAEHDQVNLQVGSTWLLKRWHDSGVPILNTCLPALVQILKRATHWEVHLHVLQILATIAIPPKLVVSLKKILPTFLSGDNKFVRAWAYTVLAAIGDRDSSCRKQVLSALAEAENDEAASVRARVRQIRKRYTWARPSMMVTV